MIEAPGEGWTPSRFEINTTTGKQSRSGWIKGSFGINGGYSEIVSLTHLETGWRVALFDDIKTAARAGELAEQCGDWSALRDPYSANSPTWISVKNRMIALWEDAGISRTEESGKLVWAKVPDQSEVRSESHP